MKNIYAAAYAATILVLLYCVVCAASNKKKIASTVQKLLVAATVAVVASMADSAVEKRDGISYRLQRLFCQYRLAALLSAAVFGGIYRS